MVMLTVRNLPDEVHRALRLRAAQHGHSTEAEVREILVLAVNPEARVRLGDALAALGRKIGLTNEDFEVFPAVRTWLNEQAAETLYLSSATLAELLFGIGARPTGKRKDMLAQTLDGLLLPVQERCLQTLTPPETAAPAAPSTPHQPAGWRR